jgi:hypothetical protein
MDFAKETLFRGRKSHAELIPLEKVRHTVTYRLITILPFRLAVDKLPQISGSKALFLADLTSVAISNLTRKVARAALAP